MTMNMQDLPDLPGKLNLVFDLTETRRTAMIVNSHPSVLCLKESYTLSHKGYIWVT